MMKRWFGFLTMTLALAALLAPAVAADTHTEYQLMLDSMNAQLEAQGSNVRVGMIEWFTDAASGEMGSFVFFNDRGNKQLIHDWVPFDPRRFWNPASATITYLVDQSDGATNDGLTNADTEPAIDRAMGTWNTVQCSGGLVIEKVPDPGVDPDVADGLQPGGGKFADITHAGWLPAGVLPNSTLGVTITFIFIDGAGNPTDVDNNGKLDTAFREIFYNDRFTWRIDGDIDVETVALHEVGHGLSQGHFGAAFVTLANGAVHFSPLAVMNAAYSGVRQELLGSDTGGHCSNWGEWPNN